MKSTKVPAKLDFKPDLENAARRWEAYFQGEIIDRPVVCIRAPRKGFENVKIKYPTYRERILGDVDKVIDTAIQLAESTYHGGEAIPVFCPTLGPDEIAAFCGGELCWADDDTDTNWSKPFVEDWEQALPLNIREDSSIWKRMLEFYRTGAEKMAGKMLLSPLDLHSNMDLLAAVRGPERLCMDLIDQPEMIDRAMASARAIFPKLWETIVREGHMDERGYSCQATYSMDGAAIVQCDFSIMMSPDMYKRWVLPALEEEAEIVKHAYYHWDGVGALKHMEAVVTSKGLHTMGFAPGAGSGKNGKGEHIDFLDVLVELQKRGKSVEAVGTPEQIKYMHKVLNPEKVMYWAVGVESQDEAERLLEWFVKNT